MATIQQHYDYSLIALNDSLIGFGKDDVLYGGMGNDQMFGDGYAGAQISDSTYLAAQYHGDDYLDGEDGDDLDGGGVNLGFAIQSIANNRHSTLARGRFHSQKQREMDLGTRCFEVKSGLGPYQYSLSGY